MKSVKKFRAFLGGFILFLALLENCSSVQRLIYTNPVLIKINIRPAQCSSFTNTHASIQYDIKQFIISCIEFSPFYFIKFHPFIKPVRNFIFFALLLQPMIQFAFSRSRFFFHFAKFISCKYRGFGTHPSQTRIQVHQNINTFQRNIQVSCPAKRDDAVIHHIFIFNSG